MDRFIRTLLGPAFLLLATPVFVNFAALAALRHDSSLPLLFSSYHTPAEALAAAFPLPSVHLALSFGAFVAFQAVLLVALPGRVFNGAVAPSGFVPTFRANGGAALVVTLVAVGLLHHSGVLASTALFDNALELLTLINAFALVLSAALAVKGSLAPSTADAGMEHGLLFGVYWGVELYPSVAGVQLKQLFISRVGMMSWLLCTASFAAASVRAQGGSATPALAASAGLNMLYVAKFFFFFEKDYLRAADIAVDRLGFMLAWGPLCFMPLIHNMQTLRLVAAPGGLPLTWAGAAAWLCLGAAAVWVNLDADTQRHAVRAADGECLVWGRKATVLRAPYRDAQGGKHVNLLLTCGWHGVARHFHYVPDILLLFLYCAPAGLDRLLNFSYFIYLTALLVDRTGRIDARCRAKYGKVWAAYEEMVPWKLIPGVW